MFEIGQYLIFKDEILFIQNCKGTNNEDIFGIVYIVKFKNGDVLEIKGNSHINCIYKGINII